MTTGTGLIVVAVAVAVVVAVVVVADGGHGWEGGREDVWGGLCMSRRTEMDIAIESGACRVVNGIARTKEVNG